MCAMVCLPSIRWRYMGSGLAVSLVLSISIETPTLPLFLVEKHNSVVLGHAELTMWCWEKTEWQFFIFLSKVVVLVIHTTFLVCPYVCHVSLKEFRAITSWCWHCLTWLTSFYAWESLNWSPLGKEQRERLMCLGVHCIDSSAFLSPRLPAFGISWSF